MTTKRQRLIFILISMVVMVFSSLLIMNAFKENIVFFYTPSQLPAELKGKAKQIRIGGMVEENSLEYQSDNVVVFKVKDNTSAITVKYKGVLPNLFREGQGVVAEGYLKNEDVFEATRVLAKHDEKYIPREVEEELKRTGHWHGDNTGAKAK